jgi:hypothetical protein
LRGPPPFDTCAILWHTETKITKAAMETSKRAAVVQRFRARCEPDAKRPPKILPEPPTEMATLVWPE